MQQTLTIPFASDLEREALQYRSVVARDAKARLDAGVAEVVARCDQIKAPTPFSWRLTAEGLVVSWDAPEPPAAPIVEPEPPTAQET